MATDRIHKRGRREECKVASVRRAVQGGKRVGNDMWFMVAEMDPQAVNGWLPGNLWGYVNDPQKAASGQLIRTIVDPKYLRRPVADADRMAGT